MPLPLGLRTDSDDCHRAAGATPLSTKGIKQIRAAGGAEIHRSDFVRRKPRGQELILGNGSQVKMNGRRAGGRVA
jgi:hypothetical protein